MQRQGLIVSSKTNDGNRLIGSSIIAEYKNTKVAELTPRQPLVSRLLTFILVAGSLAIASLWSSSNSWSPHVSAEFSDDLTIDYFLLPSPTETQCARVTEEFAKSISTSCPSCVVSAACPVGDLFKHSVASLQPDTLVATFPKGIAAYLTTDRILANNLCATSASLEPSLSCAKTSEDIVATYGSIVRTQDGWISLTLLTLFLAATFVVGLTRQYKMSQADRAISGHRQVSAVATWLGDLISVNLAWIAVTHGLWLSEPLPTSRLHDTTVLTLSLALTGWFMIGARHYARRSAFYDELWQCLNAVFVAGLVHVAINAFTTASDLQQTGLIWLTALILVPAVRLLLRITLDDFELWRRPVVIVGTGENASAALKAVTNDFTLGYKVIAVVDPEAPDAPLAAIQVDSGLPVVSLTQLEDLSDKVQVLIALESMQAEEAQAFVHRLVAANRRVHLIPSLRGLPIMGMQVSHFFSHNTVMLTMRNNLARLDFKIVKRVFDIAASSLGLLVLSPIFLVVSFRVARDGGSVFYGHERLGKGGKPFKCLKFRSMHVDSQRLLQELLAENLGAREEWERDFKLKDDPRITKVGKFIRETSIDELPQLINVLKGEMSLVGPRPIIQEELDRYGDYRQFYLRVRPGITGLWQVSGRSDTSYEERVGLDVWYTQNWSLVYDVAILVKTIDVVFGRRGAY